MWLSHVEIEDYSIAYFDHITTFEALYSKHCIAELNLKEGFIRLHYASDSHLSPALNSNMGVMSKFAIKGLAVPLIFFFLFSNSNPNPNPTP